MSNKTTYLQTLMHLLNGYIGSGILAMPKAFSDGGLIISCIATPIFGLLMNHCIHLLVEVNTYLSDKLCISAMDYEDIAEKTLANGPNSLRRFAKTARYIVMSFLVVSQLGSCSVYNIFIADNLKIFFMSVIGSEESKMSIEYYLLILFPVMVLLSFVKSIKHLSIASTFANLLQLVALAIVVSNLVTDIPPVNSLTKPIGTKIPLFFSTTVFSFEVIKVAIPLYKSMEKPQQMGKLFGVLNVGIVIVTAFYFTIGFLGYIKYGDEVEASLTLSLPPTVLSDCVQLMYAFAVILTYPILLYGAIDMLWPLLHKRLIENKVNETTISVSNYLFRTFLVLITFSLAALIPKLELIISLVGAVVLSFIAIIFPPILHTLTFLDQIESRMQMIWIRSINLLLLVFGLIGFGFGTYYSISDVIHEFSKEDLEV